MAKFVLEININSPAMAYNVLENVAKSLEGVAEKIRLGIPVGSIFDSEFSRVGFYDIVENKP